MSDASPGPTPQARIARAVDALDTELLVRVARGLVDVPSRFGEEESTAIRYVELMSAAGLDARVQPFAPGRANAIGVLPGTGGGRSLLFAGHLETSGSRTPQAIEPSSSANGRIAGTGIWNMKGAMAAYVAAAVAVRDSGAALRGDVTIAGVAGTWDQIVPTTRLNSPRIEGYGAGDRALVASGVTADAAIVGEPTSFRLAARHLGALYLRFAIESESESFDDFDDFTTEMMGPTGRNAIDHAARVVEAFTSWVPGYRERNAVHEHRPWASITGIEGGEPEGPVEARSATVFVTLGTPPSRAGADIVAELRDVMDAVDARHAGLTTTIELDWESRGPSVETDHPIVRELSRAHAIRFGADPAIVTVAWFSDASPLTAAGIPAINYGPTGRYRAGEESVAIADLEECARIYVETIVRFCG